MPSLKPSGRNSGQQQREPAKPRARCCVAEIATKASTLGSLQGTGVTVTILLEITANAAGRERLPEICDRSTLLSSTVSRRVKGTKPFAGSLRKSSRSIRPRENRGYLQIHTQSAMTAGMPTPTCLPSTGRGCRQRFDEYSFQRLKCPSLPGAKRFYTARGNSPRLDRRNSRRGPRPSGLQRHPYAQRRTDPWHGRGSFVASAHEAGEPTLSPQPNRLSARFTTRAGSRRIGEIEIVDRRSEIELGSARHRTRSVKRSYASCIWMRSRYGPTHSKG